MSSRVRTTLALALAAATSALPGACGFQSRPLTGEEPPGSQAGTDGSIDGTGGSGAPGSTAPGSGSGGGGAGGGSAAGAGTGAGGSASGGGGSGEAGSGEAGSGEAGSGEAGSGEAGSGEAGTGGSGEAGAAGSDPPEPVIGSSCEGVSCPPVPAGNDQCCSESLDVSALHALALDRCGVERPGVDGCYELEQQGVLDPSCPELPAESGRPKEAGCCTADGRCGTFNSLEGIGCHAHEQLEQACGGPVDETQHCEQTGFFAIRARLDVTWGGRSGALLDLTDDGRGTIVVDMLVKIPAVDDDGALTSEVRACAATLPVFRSTTLCEQYQPVFPTRIWDSASAPAFEVTGQYQCDQPGCVLSLDGFTGVVGIELPDPDGAWPTASQATSFTCPSGRGVECYPDHDSDGEPGIRVELLTTGTSPGGGGCTSFRTRAAPLNANPLAIFGGVRRTDRIDLGVRLRLGASGRLAEDCSGAEGVGLAEFVQSRAAQCLAEQGSSNPFQTPAGANTPCTANELSFVNQSLPDYDALGVGETPSSALSLSNRAPSPGPQYRILRLSGLDDEQSCADARAALEE